MQPLKNRVLRIGEWVAAVILLTYVAAESKEDNTLFKKEYGLPLKVADVKNPLRNRIQPNSSVVNREDQETRLPVFFPTDQKDASPLRANLNYDFLGDQAVSDYLRKRDAISDSDSGTTPEGHSIVTNSTTTSTTASSPTTSSNKVKNIEKNKDAIENPTSSQSLKIIEKNKDAIENPTSSLSLNKLSSPVDTQEVNSPELIIGTNGLEDTEFTQKLNSAMGEVAYAKTDAKSRYLTWVAECLGVLYILCLVVAFYPQLILNCRAKSVAGVSFDFIALNLFAFLCYTGYTAASYAVGRNSNLPRVVGLHDVIFSSHALILCFVYVVQVLLYDSGGQKVGLPAKMLLLTLFVVATTNGVLALTQIIPWCVTRPIEWNLDPSIFAEAIKKITSGSMYLKQGRLLAIMDIHWVDFQTWSFVQCLGFIKFFLDFVRLIPQIVLNAKRKSVQGLSLGMIVLEFCAAVFAVGQNGVDSFNYSTLRPITGTANMCKVFVSTTAAFLTLVILVQITCIYRNRPPVNYPYVPIKELIETDMNRWTEKPSHMETPTSISLSAKLSDKVSDSGVNELHIV